MQIFCIIYLGLFIFLKQSVNCAQVLNITILSPKSSHFPASSTLSPVTVMVPLTGIYASL